MNDFIAKFWFYIWLLIIALTGAVVSLATKSNFSGMSKKDKTAKIAAGILASMFVAYIIFEITLYFVGSERLAVACAGIASYMGTDALVALGNVLLTLVTKGKKSE
ncbi:MAG: hypothetical protein LBD84_07040 [Campylobacteraceae bacterium]|jgi:hypothetical protein|nr:hypothetical protein [Campylobacteraceae bacterium]